MLWSVSRVSAASIHLICTEKGGTEIKKDRNGESEKQITDFWSIPVSIDTDNSRATLWGETRSLSIKPDKLHIQEFTDNRSAEKVSTKIQLLIIDRKSLGFTYSWNSYISSFSPPLGEWFSISKTKKSYGICTKVKDQKGNKI
jgi:hypothetical protein